MLASIKLAALVRRRLSWQRLLDAVAPGALAAILVASLVLVVARVVGHAGGLLAFAAAIVTLAVVVAAWLRLHPGPSERSAAALADERLGLESRIATAIALQDRRDPFAQAAVADAERLAPSQFARVRGAFRLRRPWLLEWTPVAAIVAGLVWWLVPVRPAADGLSATPVVLDAAEQARQAEATEAGVREAVRILEENPDTRAALQETLAEMERTAPPPDTAADAAGREAQASERASSLQERLQKELDAPEMLEATALSDLLSRLPELPDAGKDLSQALKAGDLAKARQELERLSREATGADPAKVKAAKQSLENLSKALEKLAADRSGAERALREAGMDPKLAQDPTKAMQAAQQNPALSPQQKQELQRRLETCKNASRQCEQLATSTRECRDGSSSSASSALSRAEAQRRMQRTLAKAMGQCRNGSSLGWSMPWQRQQSAAAGSSGMPGGKGGKKGGVGGTPRIDGRTDPLPDGSFAEKRESAGDGDPLDRAVAREFVRGEGLPGGTSTAELKAVAAKVAAGLEEGTEEDPVPGRLKAAHKRYFEQWKRRLDRGGGASPGSGS